MTARDWDRKYAEGERLADFLGVRVAELDVLAEHLRRDEVAADGSAWWSGALPADAPRHLHDHATACVKSVETNLMEAVLELDAVTAARSDHDAWLSRPLVYQGASIDPRQATRHPRVEGPRDDRSIVLVEMHTAGFFRAVSGALDCLAAVTVFVHGLARAVVTADLGNLRRDGLLSPALVRVLDQAGPLGWYDWTDAMRNMLLHRGRRLGLGSMAPRGEWTGIVDEAGRAVRMAWPRRHLPCEPRMIDSHAFDKVGSMALSEDAVDTMRGVLGSVLVVVRGFAADLTSTWAGRRNASPATIVQPAKQVGSTAFVPTHFKGYDGAGPLKTNLISGAPETVSRITKGRT